VYRLNVKIDSGFCTGLTHTDRGIRIEGLSKTLNLGVDGSASDSLLFLIFPDSISPLVVSVRIKAILDSLLVLDLSFPILRQNCLLAATVDLRSVYFAENNLYLVEISVAQTFKASFRAFAKRLNEV